MSRTVINLDEELLSTAASLLGTTSKRATVHEALNQVVVRQLLRRHMQRYPGGQNPNLANPDLTNLELLGQAWGGRNI
ncbi:MAG: DUF2191 domain-containing protein [Acidimicrobiales bacterium]|nr:MAG: DUF2191 domain-containing protein [Acidimicrobiales bacterium]